PCAPSACFPLCLHDALPISMHPLASLGLVTAVVLAGACRADRPSAGTPQALRGPADSLIPSGPLGVAIRRGGAERTAGNERVRRDRKSTRLNSSHLGISYAV